VPGQAVQRLKVLAINDSLQNATIAKHRDALMQLPGIGPGRLSELIHGGVAWRDLKEIWETVNGVTEATAKAWITNGLEGGKVTVVLNGSSEWE
jgi:hypothetical protein